MKHSDLTGKIIECAYKVHNTLGFGFLEAVYQNALMIELSGSGLRCEKEKPIKVSYESQIVGDYIADIMVEEKVILELKAVKELHPAHEAQLVNYIRPLNFFLCAFSCSISRLQLMLSDSRSLFKGLLTRPPGSKSAF